MVAIEPENLKRIEAFKQLSASIIIQAVRDYRRLLVLKKNDNENKKINDQLDDTRNFLTDTNSPYHQILRVDPYIFTELADRLDEEIL